MPRGKQMRKRAGKGKRRNFRKRPTTNSSRSMTKDNFAAASSIAIADRLLNTNTAYNFTYQLQNAPSRVINIAKAYQEFKIDYVEVRFKPLYDTYTTEAATPGITVPQLYHQIIKDPSVADMVDISQFKANGLNAMSLAKDGNMVWRYKPAVAISAQGSTGNDPAIIRTSPWMNTEDTTSTPTTPVFNQTTHYGSCLWVNSTITTPFAVANIEVEVHYKFRKPRSDSVTPSAESIRFSF